MRTHTPAVQDYLKGIYMLEAGRGDGVATVALSARMGVTPASATNMLKRLDGMGLVRHTNRRGAELTDAGRRIALEVIRHHRLLETYLAEALGVPWDRVHEEAEVLEHVLSEDLEDRIAARLGHPTVDPHGHPIPAKDLTLPPSDAMRLWDLDDGRSATIERVPDLDPEVLRYLADAGVTPGAEVRATGRGPLAGPLFVSVSGRDAVALSQDLAQQVWVTR